MTRILFTLVFLLSTFSIHADESRFGTSINELLNKSIERNEALFLSQASLRCGTLLTILTQLFKRDYPSKDWSEYETNSAVLLLAGEKIMKDKHISRGLKDEQLDEAMERVGKLARSYQETYVSWLLDNYKNQGEYFGSSPILMNEFQTCRELAEEVKK